MNEIKTVKVVVVGESGAGKTALLTSFLDNGLETDPMTTIGIDFKHKIVQLDDGQSIRLQLWDTAGQERFRQLTPSYIRSSKVALLVFDLSSNTTVENLIRWKRIIEKHKGPDTITIIVGNKCDLMNGKSLPSELREIIRKMGDQYIETSAKTGTNIKQLFTSVACLPFPEHKESSIVLLNQPTPKSTRCC